MGGGQAPDMCCPWVWVVQPRSVVRALILHSCVLFRRHAAVFTSVKIDLVKLHDHRSKIKFSKADAIQDEYVKPLNDWHFTSCGAPSNGSDVTVNNKTQLNSPVIIQNKLNFQQVYFLHCVILNAPMNYNCFTTSLNISLRVVQLVVTYICAKTFSFWWHSS